MADTGSLYREIGALKAAASERTEYYARIIREQAKRIAELEASLQRERAMAFSKIQRQRHAIARLSEAKRERGKALVEERAQWNAICRDVGADPSDRYCTGEGEDGYPDAREQLRREGLL